VAYVDAATGRWREARAGLVFLCASTLETTRILLNSRTARHPEGLGGGSGCLGRFLMDHTSGVYAKGVIAGERAVSYDGYAGGYLPCFRNVTEPTTEFVRGFSVSCEIERPAGDLLADVDPEAAGFQLYVFGEVLPCRRNRVVLDDGCRDRWGIPALRIDCAYGDNEHAMSRDADERLSEMAELMGFTILERGRTPGIPGASIHEVGTARMGARPDRSVLNAYGQVWECPNVFVTDGAAFASSAWQNPTLTILALTERACGRALACRRDARFDAWPAR
jgi:choline dehydrogenase-like flavoprotein